MKAVLIFVLLFSMIYSNESTSFLTTVGSFLSEMLRADILDIIDCFLHSEIIIKDANVIIDGILTKDFNNVIIALTQVIMELKDEITRCLNDPLGKLLQK